MYANQFLYHIMNELDDLLQEIKLATDFQINKKLLKEKIISDLHIPYNNGMFRISIELIAFLSAWEEDILYLEDIFENPIEIARREFLSLCKEQYYKVMNRWHIEHHELKKIRKI